MEAGNELTVNQFTDNASGLTTTNIAAFLNNLYQLATTQLNNKNGSSDSEHFLSARLLNHEPKPPPPEMEFETKFIFGVLYALILISILGCIYSIYTCIKKLEYYNRV